MSGIPRIFGIRHHGPGSARSLRRALTAMAPDILLVEGPPDAAAVLPLLAHPAMQPPVALLIYAPDSPRDAVYYPFASFSPEWQALHYGLAHGIPTRFFDLPQAHQLGAVLSAELPVLNSEPQDPTLQATHDADSENSTLDPRPSTLDPRLDPLGALAAAAGYADGERWWEHLVEQRRDDADLFAAILEAMTALRSTVEETKAAESPEQRTERRREAWMRRCIRQAQAEGFMRIAVVCGAWHGPALVDLTTAASDDRLLAQLPTATVCATWTPWTYGRLMASSGYGAGITSPGWYAHLFNASAAGQTPTAVAIGWLTRAARLLRGQDLDASSAHVIEAVRLAEALAALRDRPLPGLPELNEATQAVLCMGSDLPMRLIHTQLIVGEALGSVPDTTPLAPLQHDLASQQKRLRMPAEATWRDYDLDLRNTKNRLDLDRSQLLHRLTLLHIPWGQLQKGQSAGKGTFREVWRVQWEPELAVALIEAGIWGNTIGDAASAYARHAADTADSQPDGALPTLTRLIDQVLLADLPDAIAYLMARLEDAAALASDIGHLMDALPPLAHVLRYGSVRNTDLTAVTHVLAGLATRISIGLPAAASALNDEAAQALFGRIVAVNEALKLVQHDEQLATWQAALGRVAERQGAHGLLAGRALRLLLDAKVVTIEAAARRISYALSAAAAPAEAAAWVEGLLRDSGTLLVHDDILWQIIAAWVASLPADGFVNTLPLLRRTFATFSQPERRLLGERARRGTVAAMQSDSASTSAFDQQRADAVLPLVAQLLGIGKLM